MSSQKLYGLNKYFLELARLYDIQKIPKVLMLSGRKGQGKYTLIHHLISYIFDKKNYDLREGIINRSNKLFQDLKENYNPNIIYYGCNNKQVKIDDIRKLRADLQKTSINNSNRFIIFDDVEYLNENCVNALLKTIEEPSEVNFFILINNQKQKLLKTLKSRSIELVVFLNNKEKLNIIKNLISDLKIEKKIEMNDSILTPGDYLKYNGFILDEKIDLNENLNTNIDKLLKLHRLKKNTDYLNFAIFLVNQYFFYKSKITKNYDENNNKRVNIIKKIFESNKFNLNQTNLITEIENYI